MPSPITDIGEVRRIITEARKLGEIPNLRGLNFAGQNFGGFDFRKCDMVGCNLSKCTLLGANFEGANLSKSIMTGIRIVNPHIYYDPAPLEEFILYCENELTRSR